MKKLLLVALIASATLTAFAQSDPKASYAAIKKLQQDEVAAARASGKQPDSNAIQAKMKAKAIEAIKDVDPSKISGKEAFDWALIFSTAERYKETCDLLRKYLATSPNANEKYTAQFLMMDSCNVLGEGDMLLHTLIDVKATTFSQSNGLASAAVNRYANTIVASAGVEDALKALDAVQKQLKFDLKEYAQAQLKQAKEREARNPPEKAPPSDEDRLKEMEKFGVITQYHLQLLVINKKAEILADHQRKDEGVKLLDDFIKSLPEDAVQNRSSAQRFKNRISLPGSVAPKLDNERGYGKFVGIESLKGKVVVLDFFAHWCVPCIMAFPEMKSFYKEFKDRGLEIVGVTTYYGYYKQEGSVAGDLPKDTEFARMGEFIKEHDLPWPVVYGDQSNFQNYGVSAIPYVVILDKKGNVHKINVGYDPETSAAFRALIEKLLNE